MKNKWKNLWEIFLTLAKVGLFTFGGGYAMISVIEHSCVEEKKWITHEEMMELIVIAESTPGPIAINCATYVGYKQGGLPGAIAGTVGMVLPSLVIIYTISMFLEHFLEYPLVAKAMTGIRAAVSLLILEAGWNMAKKMKSKKKLSRILLVAALVIMLLINLLKLRLSSIVLMVLAGGVSLAVTLLGKEARK